MDRREKIAKRMFLAMLVADSADEEIEITDGDWDRFVSSQGDKQFWFDEATQIIAIFETEAEQEGGMMEQTVWKCDQCGRLQRRYEDDHGITLKKLIYCDEKSGGCDERTMQTAVVVKNEEILRHPFRKT